MKRRGPIGVTIAQMDDDALPGDHAHALDERASFRQIADRRETKIFRSELDQDRLVHGNAFVLSALGHD
jgi:hypothetical protein